MSPTYNEFTYYRKEQSVPSLKLTTREGIRDGIHYSRKGICSRKNISCRLTKGKYERFVSPSFWFGAKNGSPTFVNSLFDHGRQVQICPGLHAKEIHIPYDKHHRVSSLVKPHQNTHNSVKYEVIRKCQITLPNMKYWLNNTWVQSWT